jgi:hypothetical protein
VKLHFLQSVVAPAMGQALADFETQFVYPLGEGASFSISHGRQYLPFFQAIGEATVLVAEHEGRVLATLAAVRRPLRWPDGTLRSSVYLGDLKVAPEARSGIVLGRMLLAMRESLAGHAYGYGIVMEGTGRTPSQYTGRANIPPFRALARLMVLSLSTGRLDGLWPAASESERERVFEDLRPAGFLPLGGSPWLRTELEPVALVDPHGQACGRLEDTRRGKRLWGSDGQEMRAAHLSRFVWRTGPDGLRLLRQAASRCARAKIPTLFVCLPWERAPDLLACLGELSFQPAPARVYGVGFEDSQADWWVDSAEI